MRGKKKGGGLQCKLFQLMRIYTGKIAFISTLNTVV